MVDTLLQLQTGMDDKQNPYESKMYMLHHDHNKHPGLGIAGQAMSKLMISWFGKTYELMVQPKNPTVIKRQWKGPLAESKFKELC